MTVVEINSFAVSYIYPDVIENGKPHKIVHILSDFNEHDYFKLVNIRYKNKVSRL